MWSTSIPVQGRLQNIVVYSIKNASIQQTLFIYFILFATLITKNIGKEEEKKKKKWRGDLTETIGAYERLGLLEL